LVGHSAGIGYGSIEPDVSSADTDYYSIGLDSGTGTTRRAELGHGIDIGHR
ncbi:hypothetical protein KI387_018250, partial [Taxus chinensis]